MKSAADLLRERAEKSAAALSAAAPEALLDRLLRRVGMTRSDVKPGSRLGKLLTAKGVHETRELQRIVNLPRRVWSELDDESTGMLTNYLKTEAGTMRLRPAQAVALCEMHDFGGLFGPLRVGIGKTLISVLAPTVLGAKRALLLVPAKLREKTRRDILYLSRHWHLRLIKVESYEMLGRAQGEKIVDKYLPDLIVADECAKLKNRKTAVTRRVSRYMSEHPETKFVALSGTVTKRSILDYWHILHWCLRHAPLPERFADAYEWSRALDEKIDGTERLSPGALTVLMNDEERAAPATEQTQAARKAYGRRLVETPGVVATSEQYLGTSLVLEVVMPPPSTAIANAFAELRDSWCTPNGYEIADPVEYWRHARELVCGFYYAWVPPAPPEWLLARRDWARFVRSVLKEHRPGLDSELQVARAYTDHPFHQQWKEIQPTFEPNTVPHWICTSVLEQAARWLDEHSDGIVWTEHVAFGKRLAEDSGYPYFGAGGRSGKLHIEDATGPIIASVASNAEGRNLQTKWSQNLIVTMMPTGILAEQLIGRTHREGQTADEVVVQFLVGCTEQWAGLQQAKKDAQYLYDTLLQDQKLLHGAWCGALELEDLVRADPGPRWGSSSEREQEE